MLRSLKGMLIYGLEAADGDIGRCRDFLFDDRRWVVRYVVVDTGKWLPDRKVLISPAVVKDADWNRMRLVVTMTKAQIEKSPHLDADAPVSRQYEKTWLEHYGLPFYWAVGNLWSSPRHGIKLLAEARDQDMDEEAVAEPHLRSTQEVMGYRIQAADGELGHVEDFIVEDGWTLRYMVVDTRNWLPGRKVLVSPAWVGKFEWAAEKVHVDLRCGEIKASPAYDPKAPVNREYEMRLYDYYGRPVYWK